MEGWRRGQSTANSSPSNSLFNRVFSVRDALLKTLEAKFPVVFGQIRLIQNRELKTAIRELGLPGGEIPPECPFQAECIYRSGYDQSCSSRLPDVKPPCN